jgi:hypothetical protein
MAGKTLIEAHGLGVACYCLESGERTPCISCSCGEYPPVLMESWEEAGRWLDDHIRSKDQPVSSGGQS